MIPELKCNYNFIPKKELLRRNDFGIKKEFRFYADLGITPSNDFGHKQEFRFLPREYLGSKGLFHRMA